VRCRAAGVLIRSPGRVYAVEQTGWDADLQAGGCHMQQFAGVASQGAGPADQQRVDTSDLGRGPVRQPLDDFRPVRGRVSLVDSIFGFADHGAGA
jgi:hypothetical protein